MVFISRVLVGFWFKFFFCMSFLVYSRCINNDLFFYFCFEGVRMRKNGLVLCFVVKVIV